MKYLITSILLYASAFVFAQTDIIEMKSRNASLKNYKRLSDIDVVSSNFGALAMEEVKNALLDSVTYVSDSVAIMYTSEYCTGLIRVYEPYRSEKPNRIKPREGSFWQAGADTVINHPLFQHQHSLDSIKEVLDRYYYFNLPADSINFIGFDNSNSSQGQSNEDAVQPVKHERKQEKNSFGWELIFMIVTPMAFLFAMNRFVILLSKSN